MPLQASIFLLVLRGYYYDADTKLYYLKTRYYDPEAGRLVSQDGIEYLNSDTIIGLNLYAYCVRRQFFTQVAYYLGESLTKMLIVSSVASGARWIIDKIFGT